ncbi:MAG: hypothetical protein HQK92_07425 [Nitrospirae bacterium]|nr:hypothetical protein [Nitrospirota bacterium]
MAEAQMKKDGIALIVDLPDNLPDISSNKQQRNQNEKSNHSGSYDNRLSGNRDSH